MAMHHLPRSIRELSAWAKRIVRLEFRTASTPSWVESDASPLGMEDDRRSPTSKIRARASQLKPYALQPPQQGALNRQFVFDASEQRAGSTHNKRHHGRWGLREYVKRTCTDSPRQ